RPMVKISSNEAMEHLRRLCQDAADILQMLDYRGPYNLRVRSYKLIFVCCGEEADFLKETVWTLQSRKPQPYVYIRSLVQSLLVNHMQIIGSVPVKQFLFHDLAELVLPPIPLKQEHEDVEMPLDPRFKLSKLMGA